MSGTPETTSAVTERPPPNTAQPLRLMLGPAAAVKQIVPMVNRGIAIRRHRLRDLVDLDKARAEKKSWVGACGELLLKLFDGPAVADACNDWVGRILPEYAPLGLFVEQFYEEMDHRLRRLQAVIDHLEEMAGDDDADKPAVPSPAARRESPGSRSLNWARLFPTAEELSGRVGGDERAAEAVRSLPASAAVPTTPVVAPLSPPSSTASPASNSVAQGVSKPGKSSGDARSAALPPVVRPVGLLIAVSADEARQVTAFLADLAVQPRVVSAGDSADVESLLVGATPPAFALVWPMAADADVAETARFQYRLGFLAGRLGTTRVCMVHPPGREPAQCPVPAIALDAHGGWQLPLARTLKRAGVAVDLNQLC